MNSGRFATFITILAVLVASALAFTALRPTTAAGGFGAGRGATPAAAPEKATVEIGSLSITVSATGTVAPAQESSLAFGGSGLVKSVRAVEGQHVVKGQVLATIDDSSQQTAIQQATSTWQASQAALDKLLTPLDANQIAIYQASIKAAQSGVYSRNANITPASIAAAQTKLAQAQTSKNDIVALMNDAGGRYAKDDPNYQLAVAQAGQADLNLQIARLNLQEAQKYAPTGAAQANVASNQAKLAQYLAGPKQSDLDQAQAAVVSAQTSLDQVQHALTKMILVAPYDGVLTHVNIKVGEPAANPAVVIDDTSSLYVTVKVDEADINSITPGQKVDLTFDALRGTPFTGMVDRVSPIADATASVITYPVRVLLDKSAQGVRVGMTANATLTIREVNEVLRVPNRFLRANRATGQTTVSLLNADGSTSTVPVITGIAGAEYTEIISGLSAGDTLELASTATTTTARGQ